MNAENENNTLREWRENSSHWVTYSDLLHSMFAPVTRALILEAGISDGQSVLDVAGGAGEPSLTIAQVVGPSGSVTCTDAIEEMLTGASAKAKSLGLDNITFRQCVADTLPFSTDSFDRAVSRLGAMFFPDPLNALQEMLRVIKPGGKLCLVVWHKSELNPFCSLTSKVMARHIESPATDPNAPGVFQFAESGKLAGFLSKAGATDVRERLLEFRIEAPISFAEYWQLRSHTSGTLREQLATLSDEETRDVEVEVEEEGSRFFHNGQMSFPAAMLVVTGTKIDTKGL